MTVTVPDWSSLERMGWAWRTWTPTRSAPGVVFWIRLVPLGASRVMTTGFVDCYLEPS